MERQLPRYFPSHSGTYANAVGRSETGIWFPAPPFGEKDLTFGPNNEELNFAPLWLHKGGTLTGIACRIASAGETDSVIRLGAYEDNGGVPGALILDAGTVAADTTGTKTITGLSATLPADLVWLCGVVQGGPTTVPVVYGTNDSQAWVGTGSSAQAASRWTSNRVQGAVSGALPDPGNPGSNVNGSGCITIAGEVE